MMGRTQEKQIGENVKGSNSKETLQAPKVNLKRTLKKEKWQKKKKKKKGDNYKVTLKDLD